MNDDPGSTRLSRLHLWQIQGVRDAMVIALLVLILYAGYAMRSVTVPLLIAFGLAYLVEPLVASLCRRFNMTRPAAVGTLMGTAGLGLILVIAVTMPIVIGQSVSFVESFRSGRFNAAIDRAQSVVPEPYQEQVSKIRSWFSDNVGAGSGLPAAPPKNGAGTAAPEKEKAASAAQSAELANQAAIDIAVEEALNKRGIFGAPPNQGIAWTSIFGSSVQGVLSTAMEFLTIGFLTALIPFYFWFFSISFPSAVAKLKMLIPLNHREGTVKLVVEMDRAVSGFVRGRIVISMIMAMLFAVGWKICGVPYAITLGLVVGVFSVVPYLSAVGLPVAIGLLMVEQLVLPEGSRMSWLWILLGPSLVYGIVQVLEGYVLIPIIAGRATDLGPVSIFVAVLAGAALAGVYGMLLSIPVAACLKIYGREVVMPRVKAWSSGEADDLLPLK